MSGSRNKKVINQNRRLKIFYHHSVIGVREQTFSVPESIAATLFGAKEQTFLSITVRT